jgi:hypothetical protein
MSLIADLHHEAMRLVDEAEHLRRLGNPEAARAKFQEAFERERQAAELTVPDLSLEPTRSVLHRSAASLALQCGNYYAAAHLVSVALSGNPPAEIAEELRDLLELHPMSESEWLFSDDPNRMLGFLVGKASDRKLRLFAVACCRRIWQTLLRVAMIEEDQKEGCRHAAETAERYADGEASEDDLRSCEIEYLPLHAAPAAPAAFLASAGIPLDVHEVYDSAAQAAAWFSSGSDSEDEVWRKAYGAETAAQCALLRDLIGNPFRPVSLDPAWLTPNVTALAQAAYEERVLPRGNLDSARLAILADALEDAGCTEDAILNHCRQPAEHVRGCWLVDLLLGKS